MTSWKTAFEGEPDPVLDEHRREFGVLATTLGTRRIDVEGALREVQSFDVQIPSWGLGVGGTRFGRFPLPGMPTSLMEKLDDIAVLHRLTTTAGSVSLHLPWDEPESAQELRDALEARGLRIGSVNSNTFQDQPGAAHSYRHGSLAHTDRRVRDQAIAHNRHVIDVGRRLGARSLTVWVADGSSYPGQIHARRAYERYVESCRAIYEGLPADWTMLLEHKPFEPAAHHSINYDWGTSYLTASRVGDRCKCLVDFGHHPPGTPLDVIVAMLLGAGRLGGFHFNDKRYADDDLTAGSVAPYQLFQVFVELTMASRDPALKPIHQAHMIDQSEAIKDPLEALIQTVDALQVALAQSLVVDYEALFAAQEANDVLGAERTLQLAFRTDVGPLVAEARRRNGGAVLPIEAFRRGGYRAAVAETRVRAAADAGTI